MRCYFHVDSVYIEREAHAETTLENKRTINVYRSADAASAGNRNRRPAPRFANDHRRTRMAIPLRLAWISHHRASGRDRPLELQDRRDAMTTTRSLCRSQTVHESTAALAGCLLADVLTWPTPPHARCASFRGK